jgi:hypothetical protein
MPIVEILERRKWGLSGCYVCISSLPVHSIHSGCCIWTAALFKPSLNVRFGKLRVTPCGGRVRGGGDGCVVVAGLAGLPGWFGPV